jgi:LysM repeat protein
MMGSFVGSAQRHGRKMKLMRSGRHTTPSQVEKVAEKAGKAAPAMAVTAGALMAVPHGHAAAPVKHSTVAEAVVTAKTEHGAAAYASSAVQVLVVTKAAAAYAGSAHLDAVTHAAETSQNYPVHAGDTLSSIAGHFYGKSGDWQWLYHVNNKTVSDPNLIYPGQTLNIPADPPVGYTLPASEMPATTSSISSSQGSGYQARHAAPVQSSSAPAAPSAPTTTVSQVSGGATTTAAGRYDCSGLESLWEQAGGSAGDAFMAAEIAMAESGGNPNAISPTADYGLWQINASHGAEATLNPLGNAEAAVAISSGGTDWGPWTTYTTGAYSDRC